MSVEYRSRSRSQRARLLVAAAVGAVIVVLSVPAVRHLRERPPLPPDPLRASWTVPTELEVGSGSDLPFGLSVAPDGRQVVFPAARDGHVQLWLQDLRTGAVSALPATDGAALPFWSPDASRIGFFSRHTVRAFDIATARIADILPVTAPRGASWNRSGDLVVAPRDDAGLTLHAADGTTRGLTTLDEAAGETAHLYPAFLADGRHFVFFVRARTPATQGIWLGSIEPGGTRTRVTGTTAQALAAGDRLLFASDGALVAQTLDLDAGQLTGPVTVLAVHVGVGPLAQLLATASNETLIYSPPVSSLRQLVWVARAGEQLGTVGAPADIWSVRIAPDGRRILATVLDPLLRTLDVVLFDGISLMPTRVSLSIDADDGPVWSPDGLRVAWVSAGRSVTVRGAGAVLPAETLRRFDERVRVTDWSPDGASLIVARSLAATREDLWLVPLRGPEGPRALVETPFADVQGTVSPDGRWIAYASDESGRFEVYVERIRDRSPVPVTRERVTGGGGGDPRWSRHGRELFFRRGSEIHVATPALGRGQNAVAATSIVLDTKLDLRAFDVAPDGQRFLLNVPASAREAQRATIVVHWMRP